MEAPGYKYKRGNAYELEYCVGDHPEVLGAATVRSHVGRDYLVVQSTAQEAEKGK